MALRMVEIILPEEENIEWVREKMSEYPVISVWDGALGGGDVFVKVLLQAEDTRPVVDMLEGRYAGTKDFRLIIYSVDATVPVPKEPRKEPERPGEQEQAIGKGISRAELYSSISQHAALTPMFIVLVVLSAIVASVGLLRDSVAVLVGAMIIAPLLGPNVSLAFATTIGDTELIWRSLKANVAGVSVALVLSLGVGYAFSAEPNLELLAARTRVGFGDITLALASGVAGALAFTTGISSALIGVMVAVALLPPLVSFGILLGAGFHGAAFDGFLVLAVNVICVNLAGVSAFLVQGVRPRSWWDAERAKRSTELAMTIWIILLAVLAIVIYFSRP